MKKEIIRNRYDNNAMYLYKRWVKLGKETAVEAITSLISGHTNKRYTERKGGMVISEEWRDIETYVFDLLEMGYTKEYRVTVIDNTLEYSKSNTLLVLAKNGVLKRTPKAYSAFAVMLGVCNNPNNANYGKIGGKGITICDEWKNDISSFEKWYIENATEEKFKLTRVDRSKDYTPDNCKMVESTTKKSILRYSKDGVFWKEYGSAIAASEDVGITKVAISNCVNMVSHSTTKGIFVRKNENLKILVVDMPINSAGRRSTIVTIRRHLLTLDIKDNLLELTELVRNSISKEYPDITLFTIKKITRHNDRLVLFIKDLKCQ